MNEGIRNPRPSCIFDPLNKYYMKKIILSVTLLASFISVFAQPVVKPVKPATPAPILKTTLDSVSYILGESAGYNLVQQGFGALKLNMNIYNRGMGDIIGKKKPLMDDATANAMINRFFMKMQEEKSKGAIEEGQKFLAQNKLRPGVKTTASGLQYEILNQGTGEKMSAIDTFVCNYRGTLTNGQEFDASANRGQPLTMSLTDVINGWKEALPMMPVGSKFKLYVPYQLGYGTMGQGQIPGGAVLIFEMELLDFKKKK
jgi:FKBP-type peptidyl-prolyl cis-trans isomerase